MRGWDEFAGNGVREERWRSVGPGKQVGQNGTQSQRTSGDYRQSQKYQKPAGKREQDREVLRGVMWAEGATRRLDEGYTSP